MSLTPISAIRHFIARIAFMAGIFCALEVALEGGKIYPWQKLGEIREILFSNFLGDFELSI